MVEFTEEELKKIKHNMSQIGNYIPKQLAKFVWDTYKRITDSREPQPCNCGSSGNQWRKAVITIQKYLEDVSGVN
jgi:hypothetical protein